MLLTGSGEVLTPTLSPAFTEWLANALKPTTASHRRALARPLEARDHEQPASVNSHLYEADELWGRRTVAESGEDKVRQDPPSAKGLVNRPPKGLVKRHRVAVAFAVVVAVLALARCGGDVVALGRTDLANGDQTFRNGSFLITTTGLAYGGQEIGVDAAGKSRGASAYKPENGQFTTALHPPPGREHVHRALTHC